MSRTKYLNKYRNNKYDRLEILLPQGQKKTLSDLCSSLNISINGIYQDINCKRHERQSVSNFHQARH